DRRARGRVQVALEQLGGGLFARGLLRGALGDVGGQVRFLRRGRDIAQGCVVAGQALGVGGDGQAGVGAGRARGDFLRRQRRGGGGERGAQGQGQGGHPVQVELQGGGGYSEKPRQHEQAEHGEGQGQLQGGAQQQAYPGGRADPRGLWQVPGMPQLAQHRADERAQQ